MTCSAAVTKSIAVRLKPDVSILPLGSTTICYGNSVELKASINNKYDSADYHYLWSGNTTDSVIKVDSSATVTLVVKDGNCISSRDTVKITARAPFNNEVICLVTFDNTTGFNLITWERTANQGIASYNIYKFIGTSYSLIGNVGFNSLSFFEDITSQPEIMSERYSITSLDTCGNESKFSPYHETINLLSSLSTDSGTANLSWNAYVEQSGSFVPAYYYIYKGSKLSNMVLLDSVTYLNQYYMSYKDTAAVKYYFIGVRKTPACNPAALKINEGPYSEAISNIEDNRMKSDTNQNLQEHLITSFGVAPNPFSSDATVSFNLLKSSPVWIEIYSTLGIELKSEYEGVMLPGSQQVTIHSDDLFSGIYVLKLISGSQVEEVAKIVVNK